MGEGPVHGKELHKQRGGGGLAVRTCGCLGCCETFTPTYLLLIIVRVPVGVPRKARIVVFAPELARHVAGDHIPERSDAVEQIGVVGGCVVARAVGFAKSEGEGRAKKEGGREIVVSAHFRDNSRVTVRTCGQTLGPPPHSP